MSNIDQDTPQLTIQQLSEILDVPKPTLRFWEKELKGIIVTSRTPGGQRRYTESHIPVFEKIKNLRNAGKSISQVKEYFNNGSSITKSPESEIDMLTKRISDLVKMEVTKFLGMK